MYSLSFCCREVVKDEQFLKISLDGLLKLIQSDDLNVPAETTVKCDYPNLIRASKLSLLLLFLSGIYRRDEVDKTRSGKTAEAFIRIDAPR